MKAMVIDRIASLPDQEASLAAVELPIPEPEAGEIRIKVCACGVCHTELDEIEGRTAPPRLPVVPGHEVVGRVDKRGSRATRFDIGERVGVGWIYSSSGTDDENLSPSFRATGRDVNGGYAQYMTVLETYAYPIPAVAARQSGSRVTSPSPGPPRTRRASFPAPGSSLDKAP